MNQRQSVILCLAAVLLLFGALVFLIPIGTTVQIGADEGFELAKATLCLKGYKLYTDVWNDHAPLHTFLITELLRYVSPSVAGPRLVTVGFAGVLIGSVFLMGLRLSAGTAEGILTAENTENTKIGVKGERFGLLCGVIAAVLLIGSPGFLELSSSCMLEIPSLTPGVAALCILYCGWGRRWRLGAIIAGVLFGISLGMKLIGVVLLPIAAVVLWTCSQKSQPRMNTDEHGFIRRKQWGQRQEKGRVVGWGIEDLKFAFLFEAMRGLVVLGVSCVATFVALDVAIDGGAFLKHFQQSWMSHFAPSISSEYGSPNDHKFPFILLVKNWDLTVPALIGVVLLCRESRRNLTAFVPVVWLAFALGLFTIHKPWWTYYYVHIAVPLSLCAAFGLARSFESALSAFPRPSGPKRLGHQSPKSAIHPAPLAAAGLYAICAILWIGSRAYLEISGIRKSPQTYYALVLNEIERFKPFTQWIYADNLTYSFYSRIPMPPQLAVIPLKRLWSGEMTNAGIRDEMQSSNRDWLPCAMTHEKRRFKRCSIGSTVWFIRILQIGYMLTSQSRTNPTLPLLISICDGWCYLL